MPHGLRLLSLLLFAASSHAALNNQLIQSEEVSRITLAGKIGEAAMYAVQADEDDDLEIFATASSDMDSNNDHWLLLDWNSASSEYDVLERGTLQSTEQAYLSSIQINYQEILIGHEAGLLSKIQFVDDPNSTQHTITTSSALLSSFDHELDEDIEINLDIKSIVSLTATDQTNVTVLCTNDHLHIYSENQLSASIDVGGYCQTGNVDYTEISPALFDEELVTQDGLYFTFDGTSWNEKFDLATATLGDNFKISNIDDDAAEEILSQSSGGQLKSFSPINGGSWVYISALTNATNKFNSFDTNDDDVDEIFFDYSIKDSEPNISNIVKVSWDTDKDSHFNGDTVSSPYNRAGALKYLPTTLTGVTPSNFYLFSSNSNTANPITPLLHRFDIDLTDSWSGLLSTATRSFDTITRVQNNNDLIDFNLVQLEQIDLGADTYQFAYKKLNLNTFTLDSTVEPDFNNNEVTLVNSLTAFDFDVDGVDELHAGGKLGYAASQGMVLSSNLDGSDHKRLDTPFIESVSALYIGNINLAGSPDVFATGKNSGGDGGIAYQFHFDNASNTHGWFKPGSGDTDFKYVIASNIKGDDQLEILGLHSQLTSYNPNAIADESSFYNLSNLDLAQFTPVSLENRDYQFALATDAAGFLHLIEPKDLDLLASIQACGTEISAITNIRINNNVDIALGLCGQTLKSWAIKYDKDILDYGYELVELASYDLTNITTDGAQLSGLITDNKNSLIAIFKNQFKRFELNMAIGTDTDGDGYLAYEDHFPTVTNQWADADQDGYGDNLAGDDPDPSLNDTDNDGVLNNTDLDNNSDNGAPSFTNTPIDLLKAEYTDTLTNVTVTAPTTTDLYDVVNNNGLPVITASINGATLSEATAGEFEAALAPGVHTINWQAADTSGNTAVTTQDVWVYPSIAFKAATQTIGESQSALLTLKLSGTSPFYPFDVNIFVAGGGISNEDVTEDLNNLVVSFYEGETEKTLELIFPDDTTAEPSETLSLLITDDFNSAPGNESWTVDAAQNTHVITVVDANAAPNFVSSSINQNNSITSTPNNVDGDITLTANFSDTNTLTYFWDLSTLNMGDALLQSVSFSSAALVPGVYLISVTATDDGLPSKAYQEFISLTVVYGDTDKDGYNDNVDAFPENALEHQDTDGDGVGDKADVYPDNKNETQDTDGDEVGDNADAFPNDATETKDSDNDGVGDNADVFPNDKNETLDSDGDEAGDNGDAFPNDASETKDSDGDGVGDNTDVFPNDKNETVDTDGDGVGDNSDDFPNDAAQSRKLDDQSLEDSGAGSLHYILMLMLMTLMSYRRKA